jgi:3-oxoadipate enol-lactonase
MPGKDALVFLHGVGGNGFAWQFQEKAFSDRYRVICWDAPGYAGRDLIDPFNIQVLADQLASDLNGEGIASCHLVGHSFGGMTAQAFAKSYPERLLSLTLSGTSAAFGNPDGDFQKEFLAARMKPLDEGKTLADLAPDMVASLVGDNPDQHGIKIAVDVMSSAPNETYRKSMEAIVEFDLRHDVKNISVSTLVLAGEKDVNAPAAMMERMAGRITGAKFVTLSGTGHLANLEQPALFNEALNTFLTGI